MSYRYLPFDKIFVFGNINEEIIHFINSNGGLYHKNIHDHDGYIISIKYVRDIHNLLLQYNKNAFSILPNIKKNRLFIPKHKIKLDEIELYIMEIVYQIKSKNIDFPYRKNDFNTKNMMNELIEDDLVSASEEPYVYSLFNDIHFPSIIQENPCSIDIEKPYFINDMFLEEYRLKSQKNSILSIWEGTSSIEQIQPLKKIIEYQYNLHQSYSMENIRDTMDMLFYKMNPITFNPAISKVMLDIVGSKKVLDINMNYGECMIGGIAYVQLETYDGILHTEDETKQKLMTEMKNELVSISGCHTKITMYYKSSFTYHDHYDTIYVQYSTNSFFYKKENTKTKTIEKELNENFYMENVFHMIKNSWNVLHEYGYIIIMFKSPSRDVNDEKKLYYLTNLMIDAFLPQSHYVGMVRMIDQNIPEYVYVWTKQKSSKSNRISHAHTIGSSSFTHIWNRMKREI